MSSTRLRMVAMRYQFNLLPWFNRMRAFSKYYRRLQCNQRQLKAVMGACGTTQPDKLLLPQGFPYKAHPHAALYICACDEA